MCSRTTHSDHDILQVCCSSRRRRAIFEEGNTFLHVVNWKCMCVVCIVVGFVLAF